MDLLRNFPGGPAYDPDLVAPYTLHRSARPEGVVVYLHGVITKQFWPEIQRRARVWVAQTNYDFAVPTYPGYGGRTDPISLKQTTAEVANLVRVLIPRYGRVVVCGMSLGAMIAAEVARSVCPSALILHVPYNDMNHLGVQSSLPGDMSAVLSGVTCPLGVIVASDDLLIPRRHADKILAASGARKKIKVTLAGSGHSLQRNEIVPFGDLLLRLIARLLDGGPPLQGR